MHLFAPPAARLATALLFATVSLQAAGKYDLDRVTPVPANEKIPVQDFFRPAMFSEASLNLSGTHLAAVITAGEDRRSLMVTDLESKKPEYVRGAPNKDVYNVRWLDDRRVLFSLGADKLYGIATFAGDVGRINQSYPVMQFAGIQLVGIREQDRRRPLAWMRVDHSALRREGRAVIIDTNLETGPLINLMRSDTQIGDLSDVRDKNDRHILARYPVPPGGVTAGYLADKDGELAFAFTAEDGYLTLHRLADGAWEKCPVDLDEIDVVDAGHRPGELIVVGPHRDGKPRPLQFMDAVTGELKEILVQDAEYDFDGYVLRDPATRLAIGAVYQRNGPHVVWFRPEDQAIQKMIQSAFPGQAARIVDRNLDGSRFLVRTFSDRQPSVYHWVDLKKRSMGLVKNSSPWIDPARMQAMQILKYTTRDGRKLDAYLTLPAGATKEAPAPLVVLPHGGPYVRDTWGFDVEAQFLASRGYAVLQPNYRGSPGYDWMFPEADRWDFRKMHDDVTDAAKTALKLGVLDPDRVAIMGGSFGAYLAISGVAHEPEFYRCAVSIAGVFDWVEMMRDAKYSQFSNPRYGWIKRRIGDPKKEEEKFEAISPVRHVDKVRVPVFVSHGKEDSVASVVQSRRLLSELKKHDVPHEVLLVGGEGHGMGYLKNRVELYTRIEAFLAKNLAPRLPAAAARAGE